MNPLVLRTLADEQQYLDDRFGAGRYRLAGRKVQYHNGRAYDWLDVVSGGQRYPVVFDSSRIRPAGAAMPPPPASGLPVGWWIPVVALAVIAGVEWSRRRG